MITARSAALLFSCPFQPAMPASLLAFTQIVVATSWRIRLLLRLYGIKIPGPSRIFIPISSFRASLPSRAILFPSSLFSPDFVLHNVVAIFFILRVKVAKIHMPSGIPRAS